MRCHPLLLIGMLGLIPFSLHADAAIANEDEGCSVGPQRSSIEFSHREPGGIGYPDGYTSMRYFGATPLGSQSFIPFLDLRAHLFNSAKWAANAGRGARYVFNSAALGFNA